MAPPHAPSKMTGGICETRERAQRQRKVRRRQQQRREQRSPPGHWRPAGQSVTGSGAVSPGGWGGGRGTGSPQSQRLGSQGVLGRHHVPPPSFPPQLGPHAPLRSCSCLVQLPQTHLYRGQREREEAETRSGSSSFCSAVASSPCSRELGLARPQGSGRVPPAPPHRQGQ